MPEVGTIWTFDYTGGEQVFKVPVSGIYKLETWGAQGATDSENYYGGYGGYSIGTLKLNNNRLLYLYVGGKGKNINYKTENGTVYGYPNGGSVSSTGIFQSDVNFSSGGGSTHILAKSGSLSQFSDSQENILLVAGGGGGACAWWQEKGISQNVADNGGSGGGFIGMATEKNYNNTNPTGGSQSAGGFGGGNLGGNPAYSWLNGSFGVGGGSAITTTYNISSGGGGYYGGGASWGGSGAGGSGYIGNTSLYNKSMYCYNCEESSEESTKTISTTCTSETPTENCSKQGNGYARITLISY